MSHKRSQKNSMGSRNMYASRNDCHFHVSLKERLHAYSHIQKMASKPTWQFISKLSVSSRSLKFGHRIFFSEWRHSRSHSCTHKRVVSACVRFLRWSILKVALFRLVCHAWRESKVHGKNGCGNSKVSEASEKRDRIPTPWKHEIPFPIIMLIPAYLTS